LSKIIKGYSGTVSSLLLRQVRGPGVDETIDLLLEIVDAGVADLIILDAVLVLILSQNVAKGPGRQ
jgi:hypothetical protein